MPPAANKPEILIAARRAAGLLQEASAATDALVNALSRTLNTP